MFRDGQIFKVKLELSPGKVGFGRAKVLEANSKFIVIQIKSSKGKQLDLPKGTKIGFIDNAIDNRLLGIWSSSVSDSKMVEGMQTFECRQPKFIPFSQKRKQARAQIQVPVDFVSNDWKLYTGNAVTRNLSRSGVGISVKSDCTNKFEPGVLIDFILIVSSDPIPVKARVIRASYDWLSNDTDVGFEFVNLEPASVALLDRVLIWLGGQPSKGAPSDQEKVKKNTLEHSLKTTKEVKKIYGDKAKPQDLSKDQISDS